MAYALRYYKEFTHADGKVIRLEIHKKDSTTAAVEIGAVVQGLSLQIQGQQGDIDTPIVKTSLSMTFVDAGDIENGQKNGFWEEFYTPDSVLWKVLVKAKKAGGTAFTTIWGGYVTPDSFSESLTYRGSVNIIARDNIGHMQDFPFDAEGDEDGMISLYDLVNTAWAKIESPMSLMWDGGHWMQCEGVNGYNTLMNVSAFEGMSWYEAVEKALYSYGGVMRYIGGNEVLVTTLRYMPTFGRNIDRLPRIEPTFITGATRELVPAVKRVEESVKYDLNKDYQQKIDLIDFFGNVYDVQTDWGTVDDIAWGLMATSPMAPFGWYNEVPYKTLAFNPKAYEIDDTISESDREDIHGNTCILTGTKDDDTYSLSYAMTVGPEDFAINIKFGRFLTRWTNLAGEHSLGFPTNFFGAEYKVRFAVKVVSNGITSYLAQNGEWVAEQATQQVTVTGDSISVNVPLSGVFAGNVQVSFVFLNIDTGDDAVRILQILGMSLSDISTKPMLETNTVNTNYQEGNNVVLSRDPEIGPAYNTVALPAFIKNGIFRREGSRILPAYKWGWSGSTPQQMAVYNHLQLLAYYAKPNNLISGTIVNADVTDIACIYEWHHADHILVSGNLNLLNGHIEGAMLREYARYEYLWADVEGAGFPETEQASTTNVEGGASAGGSSSTYTNNTTVNIGSGGSGGGASYLGDLQDVDIEGVVAQSVLYYNGTSWVDMSIHTLLNPYVKGDELNRLLDEINAEIKKRALDSDLDTLAGRVGVNELAIADNAGNIKKNFDAIEALGSSKADKATTLAGYGITDAYTKTEVANELAKYILKEAASQTIKGDLIIEGNLVVTKDTSSGGTGGDAGVAGTLLGIKVNGVTYDNPVNGILTIPDYPTSLTWSAIDGKPTKVSEFTNDAGFVTSAQLASWSGSSNITTIGTLSSLTVRGNISASTTNGTDGIVSAYKFNGDSIEVTHLKCLFPSITATAEQASASLSFYEYGSQNLRGRIFVNNDGVLRYSDSSSTEHVIAHQSWVEGKGYITGITAGMIGTALGSANNGGKVVISTGGGLGWQSLPTSLPASDVYAWAKKSSLALADVPDLSSKYLSVNGGTIDSDSYAPLFLDTTDAQCRIQFRVNNADKALVGYNASYGAWLYDFAGNAYLGVKDDGTPHYNGYTLYHTGNFNPANYLPLSGGKLESSNTDVLTLNSKSLSTLGVYLRMEHNSVKVGEFGCGYGLGTYMQNGDNYLAVKDDGYPYYNGNIIIHSGNYSSYALPKSGGTIDSTSSVPLVIKTTSYTAGIQIANSGGIRVFLGWNEANGLHLYNYTSKAFLGIKDDGTPTYNTNTLIHSGNIGSQSVASLIPQYVSNLDSATSGGVFTSGFQATNRPASNYSTGLTLYNTELKYYYQLAFDTTGGLYARYKTTTAWEAWKTIAFTDSNVAWSQGLKHSNGTIGAVVNSSGNVTIGSSDLAGTSAKLYVNGMLKATSANFGGNIGINIGMTYTDSTSGAFDLIERRSSGATLYFQYNHNGGVNLCNGGGGVDMGGALSVKGAVTMSSTLSVSGNITCSSNLIIAGDTATGSDIRFKDRIANHRIALESIANAPLFTFKWNDREDKTEHLGTSAQYWEGVAPWLVKGLDFKALDYSTLGVAIGISLANKALNHEERIKILENKIEALEAENRRLRYGS